MLYLALRMARHRIAALLAVACAALGGAAFVTAIGVFAESGFRSHAPVSRLARADVVVSAPQTYQAKGGDLPIALPERARVPGGLTARLARLPGVTAAVADVSFPAAVPGATVGDPRTAGHGWASTGLLANPRVTGTAPDGPREVALDERTAAARVSRGSRDIDRGASVLLSVRMPRPVSRRVRFSSAAALAVRPARVRQRSRG